MIVPLSSPRFKSWALANARRQGLPVLCVVNSTPIEEFGELDPDVTWIESEPGKPNAIAKAGEWLQANAPDALVVQHDQDDYYPVGSAALKLAALAEADLVGSPVRRVWFERDNQTLQHEGDMPDYWHSWGGSYAWRASAFVPRPGPSELFDDVYWVHTMVESGARFAAYETIDTYCRWVNHRHVWKLMDSKVKEALRLQPVEHDPGIVTDAQTAGCLIQEVLPWQ